MYGQLPVTFIFKQDFNFISSNKKRIFIRRNRRAYL